MNLDKITIFVDAVRMGSFHKAAEKYFYTPSALTRLTNSLEKELGVKLLERSASGVRLTAEGEALFPYFEGLLVQKQELFAAAAGLAKKRTTLTVGCYASISTSLLPELILSFQQATPSVKIAVVVGNTVADMEKKGAELCFASEEEGERLNFLPLQTDEYVAVVQEGSFPKKHTLTKADFAERTFLMPADSNVKKWAVDVEGEVTSVVADDDAVILSMVKNGLGVSVLPYLAVKNHPRGVKLLKIDPPLYRSLGAVYRDTPTPQARKLLRYLVENT